MLINFKKIKLPQKANCDKFRKPFYLTFFLISFFLISSSPVSSAPKSQHKPTDHSPLNEDYIKAKLSVERFFNVEILTTSLSQIRTMKEKELTFFIDFIVNCGSFFKWLHSDRIFKDGIGKQTFKVLEECRVPQRHYNIRYNKDREVDWLIDDMLTGVTYVHIEFGGTRFKEDFITRKGKVERAWIRAIKQRYLDLEGNSDKDGSPKT